MAYVAPRTFPVAALSIALATASEVATPESEKGGGWLRLASVASMSGGKPYAIGARALADGRVQIGCSCPHWKFRCQTSGDWCKHQSAFFMGGLTPKSESGKVKVWFTDGGKAFLTSLAASVTKVKNITKAA